VISLITIVAFLLASIWVAKAESAVESGPITIRADGSIDPPTAPIQREGNYYTLTADIVTDTDGIIVEASNIMFDGDGHLIQGNGTGTGILLLPDLVNETSLDNVTVKSTEITNFENGMYMPGVLPASGDFITISGNKMMGNHVDLHLDAFLYSTICGNSLGSRDSLTGEYFGYNDVYENNMSRVYSDYGLSDNVFHGNNIAQIALAYAGGNVFYENNITLKGAYGDGCGVILNAACETFYKNNIRDNLIGVLIGFHSQNTYFYNNNFINNTEQVRFGGEVGPVGWNGNYTIGGNYWDSYAGVDVKSGPYQNLTGSDGIGDTAYFLGISYPECNYSDNYPLMHPVDWTDTAQIPEFPSFVFPLLFMIATLLAVIICKRKCFGFLKG